MRSRIPPMKPLALCLPVSPHDVGLGMELARLWADIEPSKNEAVEVIIALRYDLDTNVVPNDVVLKLREKFKSVHVIKSQLIGVGFPHGCNALEVGAYQWFVERRRDKTLSSDYLLIAEADTIPLRPTWLQEISDEVYRENKPILGTLWNMNEGFYHINGNCVMHKDFWKQCGLIWSVPPSIGWDVYIGKVACAIGHPSDLIWQDYQYGMPHNPYKGDEFFWEPKEYTNSNSPQFGRKLLPALFHGIKTVQGIDAVRRRYNLPERV